MNLIEFGKGSSSFSGEYSTVRLESSRLHIFRHAIVTKRDGNGMADAFEQLAGQVQFRFEKAVVVRGVVMRDDPAAHRREFGQQADVGNGGVAPADLRRVFLICVLRLVDEQVNAGKELDDFLKRGRRVRDEVKSNLASRCSLPEIRCPAPRRFSFRPFQSCNPRSRRDGW